MSGERSPHSRRLIAARSSGAAAASCAWVSPARVRAPRKLRPNARICSTISTPSVPAISPSFTADYKRATELTPQFVALIDSALPALCGHSSRVAAAGRHVRAAQSGGRSRFRRYGQSSGCPGQSRRQRSIPPPSPGAGADRWRPWVVCAWLGGDTRTGLSPSATLTQRQSGASRRRLARQRPRRWVSQGAVGAYASAGAARRDRRRAQSTVVTFGT